MDQKERIEQEKKALKNLKKFVLSIAENNITNKAEYRQWIKEENEKKIEKLFNYNIAWSRPSIKSLVGVFFHPEKPLIGLNYTPVAHNLLYRFQEGWTSELKMCRGIIFDRNGNLAAKPFSKFFNLYENAESLNLPDESFEATLKHDGHLVIIFKYNNEFIATTRGSFESQTAKIANKYLKKHAEKYNWNNIFPEKLTILTEFLHPRTKVHVEYKNKRGKFMLIGVYNKETLNDFDYEQLKSLSKTLRFPITEIWNGNSIAELNKLISDLNIQNKEGYVARFQNGLRVKFKFATYINKIVEEKLNYNYIVKRMMSGNLEKMIKHLPEEIYANAVAMIKAIEKAKKIKDEKERKNYLYSLMPESQAFKTNCRALIKLWDKK